MTNKYYHYGITRCKEICIKQVSVLFKEDGVCAPIRRFYYEDNFTIQVEQSGGCRTTTIISDSPMRALYLWGVFHYVDKYFMLCEGQFAEIKEITFISDTDATESLERFSNICIDERANCFHSADFCKYQINCWLNPISLLSQELFDNWIDLLDKLDIIHNVVLYNVSNVGITIDVKAMFLIESFEGLADLLKDEITFRKAKYRESQLNIYLIAIINEYGKVIFQKEIAYDIEKVTKVFVDSRNRIAHIKTKSDKKYLDGGESLIYTIKMFYLYRVVLFHLIGIELSSYNQKIKKSVDKWDNHNGIVDMFLDRLN